MKWVWDIRQQVICTALVTLMQFVPLTSASAQEQRLTRPEAREYAAQLLRSEEPRAAREVALGLLQADPNDVVALILLSQAERALGQLTQALEAAQDAWRLADGDEQKFSAAMVGAQAQTAADKLASAQFWMRRAAQHAPTQDASEVVARDYDLLRKRNPLSVNLSFGVTPSDNVNGGNSNAQITFAYLPGVFATVPWAVPAHDLPLSGVEIRGDATLSYRIAQTPLMQRVAKIGLYASTYVMSEESRIAAPAVTGKSLSYAHISAGVSQNWVNTTGRDPFNAGLDVTHAFLAGSPYTTDISGYFGRSWTLPNDDQWALASVVSATHFWGSDTQTQGLQLRGQWTRQLANDDGLALSIRLHRILAPLPDQGFSSVALSVNYDFGAVGDWTNLSLLLQGEKRVFDASAYDPLGRTDLRKLARLQIGLPNAEFYGFTPVVSVEASQSDSSVPFFDTQSVKLGASLRSSF